MNRTHSLSLCFALAVGVTGGAGGLSAATLPVVPAVRSEKITSAKLPPEGYRIRIDAEGRSKVEFADEAGWFYANQTLDQLPKDAKGIEIEDWPAYRWRGVMLDEGRHFFGKAAVKDILARMGALKMNVFHWHLTEDQGWRLDIPGMPELHARIVGSESCNWTEGTRDYECLKAKMWPRTAALAEVLWTGASRPGCEDFLRRMKLSPQ